MKQFRNMLYPYVVWLFIMVLVPMLMILLYAFTTAGNEVTTFRFTLDNFSRFLTDTVFLDVLKRSLLIAVVTTVVCVLLGYPIAYTIAKGPERSGFFWIMLITLPTWINMLVRTYAWVGILQDDGLVNRFLGMLGIGSFHMLYTTFAVVLGMVYNFIPFMILQIHSSLAKMDKSLLERPWRNAHAELSEGDTAPFPARCAERDYAGVPACGVQLLYSEASGRRTVCTGRQCH